MAFYRNRNLLSSTFFLFALQILFFAPGSQDNPPPKNTPGPRWGHVFIHNPAQQHILLFGGTNKRGGPYLDETWIWKNGKWQEMDVPGPSARGFCAVAHHAQRQTIMLHGGRGDDRVTYSDLWEWNGETWTQLADTTAFKADHHQMVYVESQNALLGFGGWNGQDVSGDTWLWSGGWKHLDMPSPPKRAAFGMAYDQKMDKVQLYGGLWINGQYADVWEWSDAGWKSLGGPYDNSSLDHHAMIYDAQLETILGFGGKNYRYVEQGTTFQIENGSIEVLTSEGPPARHSFGFTYDSNSKSAYLYGGKGYVDGEHIAKDDFWKWDGKQWEQIEFQSYD